MRYLFALLFALLFAALGQSGCTSADDHAPSPGAREMPGAMGTIELKPDDWMEGTTTWWLDSDGIDPGTPGCHIGTDAGGIPNGKAFGEACLPSGLLVESNPGADELHSHGNDIGHPDTFDCVIWCQAAGSSSGVCASAPAPPCGASARCECL